MQNFVVDEDEELRDLDNEMAEKLKQIGQQDPQGISSDLEEEAPEGAGEEDDDNHVVDIDKLSLKEKYMVYRYLQDQAAKDPHNLPMSKEEIDRFIQENQQLFEMYGEELDNDEDLGEGQG